MDSKSLGWKRKHVKAKRGYCWILVIKSISLGRISSSLTWRRLRWVCMISIHFIHKIFFSESVKLWKLISKPKSETSLDSKAANLTGSQHTAEVRKPQVKAVGGRAGEMSHCARCLFADRGTKGSAYAASELILEMQSCPQPLQSLNNMAIIPHRMATNWFYLCFSGLSSPFREGLYKASAWCSWQCYVVSGHKEDRTWVLASKRWWRQV